MKKFGFVFVVMFMIVAFTGCGKITSLSGKYVNEQNRDEYLKFSGESTVVLCADGQKITGVYTIYNDVVMTTFGSGDDAVIGLFEIKNKNTLIYNSIGVAYVKRTFWNYYWKPYLLWSTIIFVAWSLFKKIFIQRKSAKDIIKDIKDGNFDDDDE